MSEYLTSLFTLANKTAIVTGGTGGLGLDMTLALAKAGADIVSIELPNDPRAHLLAEGVQKAGRKLTVYYSDLANGEEFRKVFPKIWADGHVPDILFNCAGLNRRGKVEDLTDEQIDLVFAVNLKANFIAAQEVGRQLLKLNRPGKIINVASIAAFIANFNISAYAATKGGVVQMTKAMSNEWASKGIQCNCICPGYIKTPLTEVFTSDKEYHDYIVSRTPSGRWGLPEEFQGAVVFLASQASNHVTGTSIIVDGGILAK